MDKLHLTVVLMSETPKTPAEALRRKQGDRIRSHRKLHQWSQSDLAGRIGVTKAAVSEWENGKSAPRQHIQVAIAREFNTPWSALFGLDGEAA